MIVVSRSFVSLRGHPVMRAFIGLVLLVAAGCTEPEVGNDLDKRPVGTLEDFATLADRDDVNVLFILIDTLRADRMSAYGYERDTTPSLRYFAQTGVRFDQHWAQSSWTKTSMVSLWTSLYPKRHGVLTHRDTISEEAKLPAEVFSENGYATAGIWRNGWVAPNFNFDQGFETYMTPVAKTAPAALRQSPAAGRIDGTDIDLVFSAAEYMRVNGDRPWFLYLHMMDLHQYVTTPDNAIFGSTYSDAYDNSLRWTDEQVGMILAELHALGQADRTLVVIVSDHGEAFGEHGTEGHARDVHQEVVRTPFLLIPPFRLEQGLAIPFPTQNVDLWPTIYELLGLPEPPVMDGRSVASILDSRTAPPGDDVSLAHLDHAWGKKDRGPSPIVAVREGRYRLIHDFRSPDVDRLFDLETDPGELTDVADSFRGIVNSLRARIDTYMDQTPPWKGGAPQIELDEMHLRQLRALGYSVED